MMNQTKIILVANSKGGVGKSTVGFSLARQFDLAGYKVLLGDVDEQGSCLSHAKRFNQEYNNRFCTPDIKPWRVWKKKQYQKLFDIVGIGGSSIVNIIDDYRADYDIIILDGIGTSMGGALDSLIGALKVADLVLIPSGPSGTDYDVTTKFISIVNLYRAKNNDRPDSLLLFNRFIPNNANSTDYLYHYSELECDLAESTIRESKILSKVYDLNISIFETKRNGAIKVQNDFRNIMNEICDRMHINAMEKV